MMYAELTPTTMGTRGNNSLSITDLIQISLCDDVSSRLARAFLGDAHSAPVSTQLEPLEGNVLLEALDRFLAAREYVVLANFHAPSTRHSGGELAPPRQGPLEVAPHVYRLVPRNAIVFLAAQNAARAVLIIEEDEQMPGCVRLTAYSKGTAAAEWLNEWRTFAFENAFLRGKRLFPDGALLRHDAAVSLDDVCMTDEVADYVQRVILRFPENVARFRARGLPAKRGVLLTGPPGAGKTMLARAVSHAFAGTCIWATPRHVLNTSDVAQVWSLARDLAPTLIVLEDIDLYGESRMTCDRSDIVGELMNQMDGAQANDGILTLATTNCPDAVEEALRNRPGRFDRVLKLGTLDPPRRRQLLEKLCSPAEIDAMSIDRVLEQTDGFTGAQIVEFVKSLVESVTSSTVDAFADGVRQASAVGLANSGRHGGSLMGFANFKC